MHEEVLGLKGKLKKKKGAGHHAGVMLERFTPEKGVIFYLDTLNRVGVFFSDDFSFPLRRLSEAYLR